MLRFATTPLALFALFATALADSPIINTPTSLVVCEPSSITFSGGTAPYYITVLPGGEVSAAALETLPTQTAAGAYTWTVNIAAGTSVTLAIKDSTGAQNYAQQVTIQASSDTSCLSASSGGASASTGAGGAASGTSRSSARAATSTGRGASSSDSTTRAASGSVTKTSGIATVVASSTAGANPSSSVAATSSALASNSAVSTSSTTSAQATSTGSASHVTNGLALGAVAGLFAMVA